MSEPPLVWHRMPALEQRCLEHGLPRDIILLTRLLDLELFDQVMNSEDNERTKHIEKRREEELQLMQAAYTDDELAAPMTTNPAVPGGEIMKIDRLPKTLQSLSKVQKQPNGLLRIHEMLHRQCQWLEHEKQDIEVQQKAVSQYVTAMDAEELQLFRDDLDRRIKHMHSTRQEVEQMLHALAALIQQRESLERSLHGREYDALKERTKKMRVLITVFTARLTHITGGLPPT